MSDAAEPPDWPAIWARWSQLWQAGWSELLADPAAAASLARILGSFPHDGAAWARSFAAASGPGGDGMGAIVARLDAIEARLAALERSGG